MLSRIELANDFLDVPEQESTLSGTYTFKAGTIIIDPAAQTISFGKRFTFPLPEGFTPSESKPLKLRLVDNTGKFKPQTRTEMLTLADPSGKIQPDQIDALRNLETAVYRVSGKRSQKSRKQEDGWTYRVLKFRAYITHPGIETDTLQPFRPFGDRSPVPDSYWLTDSIHRCRLFWNRLVRRCEYARGQCETAPYEEIKRFVSDVVLAAIDAMNMAFRRDQGRLKMKHPRHLKADTPSIDSLRRFAYQLKMMAKDGVPVPVGLEEQIREFIGRHPMNRKPIFEFCANFKAIAEEEAKNFGLESYERKFWINAFRTVLERRRDREKAAKNGGERLLFSAGWPKYKDGDSDLEGDWGIHISEGQANVSADKILSVKGIRGIRLSDPVNPADSGHPLMGLDSLGRGQTDRRKLRQATISLDGGKKIFRFAVLQHRDVPDNAFVKGWRLRHEAGAYWLSYILEVQNPPLAAIERTACHAAGLDIGWRQTPDGMRIGMLWDGESQHYQEIIVNLTESPTATDARATFRVAMGPSRHGRETLKLIQHAQRNGMERMIPGYHDRGVDTFQGLVELQTRRNAAKDKLKRRIAEILGDDTPVGWGNVHLQGIRLLIPTCSNV